MTSHLKGFDFLRGLAAILVMVGHIELMKKLNGRADVFEIIPSGHTSVLLFFVLSGFLITHLLNIEFLKSETISLKNFYGRRILRIWPVYYLVIIISSIVGSAKLSFTSYFLCLTIFPNLAHAIGEGWSVSPQIWSIGVEEQFYLLWPVAFLGLMKLTQKYQYLMLIGFIVIYSLLPHFISYLSHHLYHFKEIKMIEAFFYGTKYNSLALGGLCGLAFSQKKQWTNYFKGTLPLSCIGIMIILIWGTNYSFTHFGDEVLTILFSLLLLSIAMNQSYFSDTKWTRFIGKLSYGIYMYHWLILIAVINVIPNNLNPISYNFILYSSIITLTLSSAWFSYHFIEKRFLNLKVKFR